MTAPVMKGDQSRRLGRRKGARQRSAVTRGGAGGGRFQRLRGLRCYDEVVERLTAGYPIPDIARYVQEEEGEYTDIKRVSLCNELCEYRNREICPADLIAPRLPHVVIKANKEFGERLEDLRRLERLYELGLYRIDLAHGRERRTGEIDPDVDRHMKGLIDLIHQMHEIKMDLGLTGSRDLGTLTVSPERLQEIRERYGENAAAAFADPVQRAQVLGLLKRVMRLSGRSDIIDIPAEPGEDAPAPPENSGEEP
jgi:hypothetical protein